MSRLDIVIYYASLGNPYLPLLKQVTSSAKKVMPYCRTVLLTPTPDHNICRLFDLTVPLPNDPATRDNICYRRATAMAAWGKKQEDPCIFCDPDIEFRKTPPMPHGWDIGLMWRKKVDQPVNSGVVLSAPNNGNFWEHYLQIIANMPLPLRAWFGDQLAFSLLTGVCRHADDKIVIDGSRVWLMDALRNCYTPDTVTKEAWAVHHKGQRKGEEWGTIYQNLKQLPAGGRVPV